MEEGMPQGQVQPGGLCGWPGLGLLTWMGAKLGLPTSRRRKR